MTIATRTVVTRQEIEDFLYHEARCLTMEARRVAEPAG